MKQFKCKIISNKKLCNGTWEMFFEWKNSTVPLPGNFITIRVSNHSAPLLRRPFAISSFDLQKQIAGIIYMERGPATSILTSKKSSDLLDVIGPLGNSFPENMYDGRSILVAGGIGIGPINFLMNSILASGKDVNLIYGAKNLDNVPKFLLKKNDNVFVCTDDGSFGYSGTTVDYLNTRDDFGKKNDVIYSCGPTPMLNACHNYSLEKSIKSYVSMEQMMACGVGACMGCVIKVNNAKGYARVCKEGPIFDSKDIIWI